MPKRRGSSPDKSAALKTAGRGKAKQKQPEPSELAMRRWAVIGSGGCLLCGVSYQTAEIHSAAQPDNSNTIVTLEVAAKICQGNHPSVTAL